jgi:hypothetical protein
MIIFFSLEKLKFEKEMELEYLRNKELEPDIPPGMRLLSDEER